MGVGSACAMTNCRIQQNYTKHADIILSPGGIRTTITVFEGQTAIQGLDIAAKRKDVD
jgi:hypothetical protein